MNVQYWIYGLFFLLLNGCKDQFDPPSQIASPSYLVVEGYINGNGHTTIKLSRTVSLTEASTQKPELNALVTIEGSNSTTVNLSSTVNGVYISPFTNLDAEAQYRVHIKTADHREYVSEFVDFKTTPSIDNIKWEKTPKGVQISVNTHDPENNTRYYRWDYEETWEFNSIDKSFYEWSESQQTIINRTNIEAIYTCWRTASSTRILLGSSVRLEEDLISNHLLTFIPDTSWKLSVRYSILARQYALTKKAFEYWQHLSKNTEQLGSIFDPQPSDLRGNLQCLSNPEEPVIGYISAGTIEEKRIFIDHQEIPDFIYKNTCRIDTVGKDPLRNYFSSGLSIPLGYRTNQNGEAKLVYASKECVDCQTKGTNVKPSFW